MESTLEIISIDDCIAIGRRGAGFLIFPENRFVNAYENFLGLKISDQNRMWNYFRRWIASVPVDIFPFCHGFDHTQYSGRYEGCFVFEKGDYRFYGFLSHPDLREPRFYFVSVVHYLRKKSWRTQETILAKITELSRRQDVKETIGRFIEQKRSGV